MNDKEIAYEYIHKWGHILYEYGTEDFLDFLQLDTLRKKEKNPNLNHIDTSKVVQIAYNDFIKNKDKTTVLEQYCDDDMNERKQLLHEARKYIKRLNNEELRDIIFHHPIRDIQDNEYTENDINKENFVHNKYNTKLTNEVLSNE